MPIKHRSDGWYWGSKGPFDTEKKALEVQRVAYASGYTGKSMNQIIKSIDNVLEKGIFGRKPGTIAGVKRSPTGTSYFGTEKIKLPKSGPYIEKQDGKKVKKLNLEFENPVAERVRKSLDSYIEKQEEKTYLKPGDAPPEGAQELKGSRGGRYYDANYRQKIRPDFKQMLPDGRARCPKCRSVYNENQVDKDGFCPYCQFKHGKIGMSKLKSLLGDKFYTQMGTEVVKSIDEYLEKQVVRPKGHKPGCQCMTCGKIKYENPFKRKELSKGIEAFLAKNK